MRHILAIAIASAILAPACSGDPYGASSEHAGDAGGAATPGADGAVSASDASGDVATASRYSDAVRASQPVAYWRLGENAPPTARDESPNHHDGTYVGGVTLGVPGAPCGDPDTAAAFDGKDDHVVMGDILRFTGTVPFTVELFVKPRSTAGGGLFGKNGDVGGLRGYWMSLHETSPGTTLIRYSRADALTSDSANGPAPAPGVWSHVVAAWDGVTRVVWVDGQSIASRASSVALEDRSDPFMLGSAVGWSEYAGEMDEVAVYDRVLPVDEIQAHLAASRCPK